MDCNEIVFSNHAFEKMFERGIRPSEAVFVINKGDIIFEYPEDKPHASFLMLGFPENHPLHVVVGVDGSSKRCYVITVYSPSPKKWDKDFRVRRKQ